MGHQWNILHFSILVSAFHPEFKLKILKGPENWNFFQLNFRILINSVSVINPSNHLIFALKKKRKNSKASGQGRFCKRKSVMLFCFWLDVLKSSPRLLLLRVLYTTGVTVRTKCVLVSSGKIYDMRLKKMRHDVNECLVCDQSFCL